MSETKIADLLAQEARTSELREVEAEPDTVLPAGTTVTRGHSRSKTLQIRLNADEYHELELIAKSRDLPVSTVARSLLLAAVHPTDTMGTALERLERDVLALRRQVEKS